MENMGTVLMNVDPFNIFRINVPAYMISLVYNKTAWPARAATKLEFRYYVDLSEIYKAGGNASGGQACQNLGVPAGSLDHRIAAAGDPAPVLHVHQRFPV